MLTDRWGATPLDDALRGGHEAVSSYLHAWQEEMSFGHRQRLGAAEFDLCDAASRGDVEGLRHLVKVAGVVVDQGALRASHSASHSAAT